jgi:hypothetical protein
MHGLFQKKKKTTINGTMHLLTTLNKQCLFLLNDARKLVWNSVVTC